VRDGLSEDTEEEERWIWVVYILQYGLASFRIVSALAVLKRSKIWLALMFSQLFIRANKGKQPCAGLED
jgi:hypothetical protein